MLDTTETQIIQRAHDAIAAGDDREALAMLLPVAELQNPVAMNSVGLLLWSGVGIPHDIDRAIGWFEAAAALGSGYAAHNLGTLFAMEADGGQRDPSLARYWYRRAMALGPRLADDAWYDALRNTAMDE